MKLVINDKSEILAFTVSGDVDNSVEYEGEVPEDFRDKFKSKFYMLADGVIVENPDYVAPSDTPPVIDPSKQDKINVQIMLNQAKQKENQDKFNAQILLKLAGGMK
ncbi:DUF2977 domain-containing protein [Pediococcus pentosaceus]|uniref:DUF2977 domain-containing protein n=1 Tax=Pediococcus pentosaceus TaxID=1255 RepID=UPI001361F968|nr:DUF2977 domain-containing protein [Pediococcus pentosaceus]QHM64687.1 hypothetical protein C7M48_00392 [Pediococcus pentosaceus]QHM66406.1 hypothetical protein C7M49_00305 [Pediococcus pentosaceus]QHM69441.1 hypothetical protein C7M50_01572 [Pediococcus pentosaceus]